MPLNGILAGGKFLPAALDLILRAKKSIYITTFKAELITKPRGRKLMSFFYTLSRKARAGVDIQIIINNSTDGKHIPRTNGYVINYLQSNGIKVRCLPDERICHAKMLIIDKETAIIGSHNLSVKSCHYNFEMSIAIYTSPQVQELTRIFERVWENSQAS